MSKPLLLPKHSFLLSYSVRMYDIRVARLGPKERSIIGPCTHLASPCLPVCLLPC